MLRICQQGGSGGVLCLGGKGGGRPDIAMAGGKDTAAVANALQAAEGIVAGFLK